MGRRGPIDFKGARASASRLAVDFTDRSLTADEDLEETLECSSVIIALRMHAGGLGIAGNV